MRYGNYPDGGLTCKMEEIKALFKYLGAGVLGFIGIALILMYAGSLSEPGANMFIIMGIVFCLLALRLILPALAGRGERQKKRYLRTMYQSGDFSSSDGAMEIVRYCRSITLKAIGIDVGKVEVNGWVNGNFVSKIFEINADNFNTAREARYNHSENLKIFARWLYIQVHDGTLVLEARHENEDNIPVYFSTGLEIYSYEYQIVKKHSKSSHSL